MAVKNNHFYLRYVSDFDNPSLLKSIFRRVPIYYFEGCFNQDGDKCIVSGKVKKDTATRFLEIAMGGLVFMFFPLMSFVIFNIPQFSILEALIPLVIGLVLFSYFWVIEMRELRSEAQRFKCFFENISGDSI